MVVLLKREALCIDGTGGLAHTHLLLLFHSLLDIYSQNIYIYIYIYIYTVYIYIYTVYILYL